jgi:hypothetical protein
LQVTARGLYLQVQMPSNLKVAARCLLKIDSLAARPLPKKHAVFSLPRLLAELLTMVR